MRVFIGIKFNNEVKDYLNNVSQIVKQSAVKGNYTLYENYHLTLRFLGEINQEELNIYYNVIDELGKLYKPFAIKIGDIGSFNRKNKHIVYVNVIENKEKLINLAKKLDEVILKYFTQSMRTDKFKPHITVGREVVYNPITSLVNIPIYNDEVSITDISLFLSYRDKNNRLVYEPLYTVVLNK